MAPLKSAPDTNSRLAATLQAANVVRLPQKPVDKPVVMIAYNRVHSRVLSIFGQSKYICQCCAQWYHGAIIHPLAREHAGHPIAQSLTSVLFDAAKNSHKEAPNHVWEQVT